MDRAGRPRPLAYGYEEALGYCVAPEHVRDKDGITAALLVAELAAGLKAELRTLADRLDELAREFGVYATDQISVRVDDLSAIDAMMAAAAGQAAHVAAGRAGHRLGGPAPGRRRGHRADRLEPGGGPAFRHRAEAQGVPGGTGAGAPTATWSRRGSERPPRWPRCAPRSPPRSASSPPTIPPRTARVGGHVDCSAVTGAAGPWLASWQGGAVTESLSYRSSVNWTGQVFAQWGRWTRGHWRMTLVLSVAAFLVGWVWNTYIMAVDLGGSEVGPGTETAATAEGRNGNVVYWLLLFSLVGGLVSYGWSRGWRSFGSDIVSLPRRFGEAITRGPAAAVAMVLWGMSISLIISTLISSAVSGVLGLVL